MNYDFFICDVFTDQRFGGNPLAVLPDARGLETGQMQRIAREFNFSESTFVFPSTNGCDRQVRIFTPSIEMPFAGHPNVGTAFVLASIGELKGRKRVTFEEKAGDVPVTIRQHENAIWCELTAPEPLHLGDPAPAGLAAAALSLAAGDVMTETHPPRSASVGFPFLIVELRDRATLERARIDLAALDALAEAGFPADIHIYVRSNDEFDLRARMFGPLDGVPEDPATGSANCALAALLAHCDTTDQAELRWRIAQGVEMGRPSVLEARVEKVNGQVEKVHIGGSSVMFAQGQLQVD